MRAWLTMEPKVSGPSLGAGMAQSPGAGVAHSLGTAVAHSRGPGVWDILCLDLAVAPRAVSEARQALRSFLSATPYRDRTEDAALALSELVTNAVLHGREPLSLHVALRADRLRVEVHDGSPLGPTVSVLDVAAATGRGLLLVANLADRWGLEPADTDGKAVWFELDLRAAPAAELGVEELLSAWGEDVDDPAQEVVKVVLTELDVALTARSEAHVEALLRELALVAGSSGSDAPLAPVAEQVCQAAARVGTLRAEVKRQLSRAVAEGQQQLDVVLRVTRVDVDTVRAFAQAIDEADRLSRRGLLLTAHAPYELSEARDRYLQRIMAQLTV